MARPRTHTTPRVCEQCGTTYERGPGVRPGAFVRSRFCGRACQSKAASERAKDAPRERREYVVGEVEFLLGTDRPDSIARRLGYKNQLVLGRVLRKWGRDDLARHFHTDEVAA